MDFDCIVQNTYGDLDISFKTYYDNYDIIIFNNVIEHLFNPLFCLLELKKLLKPGGKMIIGCPLKPNWITWARCHFHEFDEYRFNALLTRAGLKIIDRYNYKDPITFKGILGLRPILSRFYNTRTFVTVVNI